MSHPGGGQRFSPDSQAEPSSQTHPPDAQTNPYEDPTTLLSVYPFINYTPTARTAEHIATHTVTYPPPANPSEFYPQYATMFGQLDDPQTSEGWALRKAAEGQIAEMLRHAGSSYAAQNIPTPDSFGPSTFQPRPPSGPTQPLPYSFLPNYLPSSSVRHPPTPTSMAGSTASPSPSFNALEFIDNFVEQTLNPFTAQPPGSVSPSRTNRSQPYEPRSNVSTPTISRVLARTTLSNGGSPDPLAMDEPSPTKKRRPTANRSTSPTLRHASSPPSSSGGPFIELSQHRGTPSRPTPLRMSSDISVNPKQTTLTLPNGTENRKPKQVVIELVTRKPSHTNKSSAKLADGDESEEDDLDWGDDKVDKDGDWVMTGRSYKSPSPGAYGIDGGRKPPGSGRTGEKDSRTHLQKLQSLFESISEESDSFSAEPSDSDLASSRYFASLSRSGSLPLLSVDAMEMIIRYTTRVHSSKKRQTTPHSGDADGLEWDGDLMGRIIRLVERSMRECDGVIAFVNEKKAPTGGLHTGKKGQPVRGKKKTAKRSRSPESEAEDGLESEERGLEISIDHADRHIQDTRLAMFRSAGLAAETCLLLLSGEGLPKQLLSEDILCVAVGLVKDLMTNIIYPVVEGLAGEKIASGYVAYLVKHELDSRKGKGTKRLSPFFSHPVLSAVAQSICAAIPRINSLLSRLDITLSDTLVIQTVYLAIGPLFVIEATGKRMKTKETAAGKIATASIMKSMRLEALGCLRAAFARYEDQRQWIIEEILSSLVKVAGQNSASTRFQLTNGSSIHTISALLLQLIQASAESIPVKIRRLRSSRIGDATAGVEEQSNLIDEESGICSEMMDAALRSARVVAGYLVQKSSTSKANKTSHDTDYKSFLETFVNDLLAVLYRPEWPAASLFLSVLSRLMISAVEDPRLGVEASAARGLALDHLGDIAARLREFQLIMSQDTTPTLDEVVSNASQEQLTILLRAEDAVRNYLLNVSRDDATFAGARDMTATIWAQELQTALTKATSVIDKLRVERDEEAQQIHERLQTVCQKLRIALRNVWSTEDSPFEASDLHQSDTATQASIAFSRGRSLQSAFDPMLHSLVAIMESTVVANRSKALRGISDVVSVDPDVLSLPPVRHVIEDRLSDTSPAVRDAAVELVGKYIVQKPSLVSEYYPHIALRVTDSGLGVRKRIVKLLRAIYSGNKDTKVRVDICCKMIILVGDQDDNVKEMATNALCDMLYPSDTDLHGKMDTAIMLVEVIGEYRDGAGLMELALQAVGATAQGSRFSATVESLVNKLIDVAERSDLDVLSHVRAIWLLCRTKPDLVDTGRASVLLTYLHHPAANTDEQQSNDLLLRIFGHCIPSMPKTASTFANDLNTVLLPMINRPSGNFKVLEETIACFCTLINHLTKEYRSLMKVFRGCEAKIRLMRDQYLQSGTAKLAQAPAAPIMMYITALLAEHCDFDYIAGENNEFDHELRRITDRPVPEYLFDMFLDFSRMPIDQTAPSFGLGALFRAYPRLILQEEALTWTKRVFASNDEDNQARILGVIHQFLVTEIEKKAKGHTKRKDVEALIGTTSDLSDSGVSTAVVQRNMEHILDGAKSHHAATQNVALDILAFTVNQGLFHPLQCLPILISLETSDDVSTSERALGLHATLHSKHSTLINVRFLGFAKASYDYRRSISAEVSGHRDGEALLNPWYSLISEKRAWRLDFVKALGKVFDYDLAGSVAPDIHFILYIAENLATLEYMLQEEVMSVFQQLSAVVSTCTHLASILESTGVEGSAEEGISGKVIRISAKGEEIDADTLITCSIVVGLALLTKNHLLDLYGLPEDKCLKQVIGKKSALGDKAATRKSDALLDLSRMPYVQGVSTVDEYNSQSATILSLLAEDGS